MSRKSEIRAGAFKSSKISQVFRAPGTDRSGYTNSPIDRILMLQKTIGNKAVQRMFNAGEIQARLRIGKPGDIYEQEADRVADQVMSMPEPAIQPT